MGRYWQLIGDYNGEGTTWEALAGGFQASPYSPPAKGRIKGIRIIESAEAATSLTEGVEYRISCPLWTPNTLTFVGAGNGIDTALTPRSPGPMDYDIDQPVEPGTPITLEGRHAVGTAVTHRSFVLGLFES